MQEPGEQQPSPTEAWKANAWKTKRKRPQLRALLGSEQKRD
jgi:hypothetical protein